MNTKIDAIKEGNNDLLIKYFGSNNNQLVNWKNSRYLWCSNCKTKVKYCDTCKDDINDKTILVTAKRRAFDYIDKINNELINDIDRQLRDPEIIRQKQEQIDKIKQEIEEFKKKALIEHQKKLKRQKKLIRQKQEKRLNEIDEAWNLLKAVKPQQVIVKNNTHQIKAKLKVKVKKLLNFYSLKYCSKDNRCNTIDRHIHIIHELVPCKDLLSSDTVNLEILGHLVQFAKCVSYLFCIPLKYKVVCLGKNTQLKHRLTNELVNPYLGTTLMFIELTRSLQIMVEKYFGFTLDFNMKLKNIVYPLVIIRQILTKLFY